MNKLMFSSEHGHSPGKNQIATVLSSILLALSLAGCAAQREYSDSEKLNLPREILDGTAALRQAREEEIARQNLQIFLTASILVVVVIVALVLLLRIRTKQVSCPNCGRNISGSKFCPNCGTARLKNSESAKSESAPIPYPANVVSKKRTTSILLAVFFGFWTYLYSFKLDKTKFWISLAVSFVPLSITLFWHVFRLDYEILFLARFTYGVDLDHFGLQLLGLASLVIAILANLLTWIFSIVVSSKKPTSLD